MNEYKMAWYNETQAEFSPITQEAKPNDSVSIGKIFKEHIQSEVKEYVVGSLIIWAGTHMAQSQISGPIGMGLRTAGRVALRALPVIGTAYMAYSVYDWLTD